MKNHRQEQILEILKEKGKVNVHNLSEYFSVTPKTIRRDLEFLEENGELVRIHGGAEMTKTDILRDKPFGVRLNIEAEKKEKIGKEAAMLLKNGQRIFIGAGSTLDYLSSYIDNTNRLYVVTDSITVVNQLNNPSKMSPTLYLSIEDFEYEGMILLWVYVPPTATVEKCGICIDSRSRGTSFSSWTG